MIDIIPRPKKISTELWIDEAIWGHRFYDEQTPWLTILEFLLILESIDQEQKLIEKTDNKIDYKCWERLYLRNILFNNPYLDIIANDKSLTDQERWDLWLDKMKENAAVHQENASYEYLKVRFTKFQDFADVVRFILSNSIEGDSNKRWSSKFIFPFGPAYLFPDLRIDNKNNFSASIDRRFFARTGELLYLMICRSKMNQEILSGLIKLGIISDSVNSNNYNSKWNQLGIILQPNPLSQFEHQMSLNENYCYLPYRYLPEYDALADDWLKILNTNLPDFDALPHLVNLTGLHLIIYMLGRAKYILEDYTKIEFIIDITSNKKNIVSTISCQSFAVNNSFSEQAVKYYVKRITQEPKWKDITDHKNNVWLVDIKDFLMEKLIGNSKESEILDITSNSPDEILEQISQEAIIRHKKHVGKCHNSWSKQIGLASSRGTRRFRYTLTDSLLKTLVLCHVSHRLEFQEFLQILYDNYGFVIGERQAINYIDNGKVDEMTFHENAENLEQRLSSLGLLKRLSDACAYVQNPFS